MCITEKNFIDTGIAIVSIISVVVGLSFFFFTNAALISGMTSNQL